jgi:hypothetical protein
MKRKSEIEVFGVFSGEIIKIETEIESPESSRAASSTPSTETNRRLFAQAKRAELFQKIGPLDATSPTVRAAAKKNPRLPYRPEPPRPFGDATDA